MEMKSYTVVLDEQLYELLHTVSDLSNICTADLVKAGIALVVNFELRDLAASTVTRRARFRELEQFAADDLAFLTKGRELLARSVCL